MAKMDCEGWWAPGLGRNASIVWIGSMWHDGSRESKRNSCISPNHPHRGDTGIPFRIARIEKEFLYLPYGDDFQQRLAAHWANLNSMKWMVWNDGVEMAEFGMTRVRIGLYQHALAHPEANGERFEGNVCLAQLLLAGRTHSARDREDQEKPGAMPPSHRMSPALLDTN